jgi:membrane protease YdiL (CAAX protease family)
VEMDADWGLAGLLRPFLPALLVGLGAWAWARARGRPAAGVWGGLFAAVALSLAGGFGLLRLLGPSAGNVLLSLIFQHLLLGAAALRLLRGDAASAFAGVLPAGPVVRQGIFYLLCGLPRVALVVLAAQVLLGPGAAPASDPLSLLAQADLGPLGTLLFVLPVVVLAPIGEELLFRGWLLPQLGRQMGPGLALLLSSAVFSLLHPHYSLQILVVFFLGMILGWARLKSGGLKAPILLHMGINGVSTLFMLS